MKVQKTSRWFSLGSTLEANNDKEHGLSEIWINVNFSEKLYISFQLSREEYPLNAWAFYLSQEHGERHPIYFSVCNKGLMVAQIHLRDESKAEILEVLKSRGDLTKAGMEEF